MKFTFGPAGIKERLEVATFFQKLVGATISVGEVIVVPPIMYNYIPSATLCAVLSARKGNRPGAFVVERPFRIFKVLNNAADESIDVYVDGLPTVVNAKLLTQHICSDGGDHSSKMKIQPIDFITANELGYIEGNIIKYVCRYKSKNGVEDLKKAQHYLQMLIEQETKTKE